MKILIINGPNINMLGIREPDLYGHVNYHQLVKMIKEYGKKNKIKTVIKQSNEEGKIVTIIQKALNKYDGIIINPGAYTHTSIAVLDALKSVDIPVIEVHISDISKREDFRQISYVSLIAKERIIGEGVQGYIKALEIFKNEN